MTENIYRQGCLQFLESADNQYTQLEKTVTKGEIIEKSLKVYFAANPHFLWKHFVFDDFGITRGISKWCKHNLLDLSIFV